ARLQRLTTENVDLTIFRDGVGDASFDLSLVGYVHRDSEGVGAFRLDLRRGRFGGLEVEIGDDGNSAKRCETHCNLLTDAGRRPSDEGAPVLMNPSDLPLAAKRVSEPFQSVLGMP